MSQALALPAAEAAIQTWIGGFNFAPMPEEQQTLVKQQLRMLIFPGTELLSKPLDLAQAEQAAKEAAAAAAALAAGGGKNGYSGGSYNTGAGVSGYAPVLNGGYGGGNGYGMLPRVVGWGELGGGVGGKQQGPWGAGWGNLKRPNGANGLLSVPGTVGGGSLGQGAGLVPAAAVLGGGAGLQERLPSPSLVEAAGGQGMAAAAAAAGGGGAMRVPEVAAAAAAAGVAGLGCSGGDGGDEEEEEGALVVAKRRRQRSSSQPPWGDEEEGGDLQQMEGAGVGVGVGGLGLQQLAAAGGAAAVAAIAGAGAPGGSAAGGGGGGEDVKGDEGLLVYTGGPPGLAGGAGVICGVKEESFLGMEWQQGTSSSTLPQELQMLLAD